MSNAHRHCRDPFADIIIPLLVLIGRRTGNIAKSSGDRRNTKRSKLRDKYRTPLRRGQIKRFGDRKVGRNEPCPCGSGKKFKRCHGHWSMEADV